MSGKRKSGGDRLQERAQELIERGLTSYRRGEVEAAVIDWRHALALDPHADRAREYIEHAQAHRELDDLDPASMDTPREIGPIVPAGVPAIGPVLPAGVPATEPGRPASRIATEPGRPASRIATEPGRPAGVPATGRGAALGSAPDHGRVPTSPALPRVLRKTFEGPPMPSERLGAHFARHSDGSATEKMPAEASVEPLEPRDTQPLALSHDAEAADTVPPEGLIEEMPPEDTEPLHRPPPGLVQDEPPVSLAPTVELARSQMEQLSQEVPANIRTLARTQLDALETYEIHLAPPDAAARADRSKRSALPPVVIEDVEEDDGPESAPALEQARPRTQTAQLYGAGARVPSRPPVGLASSVSRVSIALPEARPGAVPGGAIVPERFRKPAAMPPVEPELPRAVVLPDDDEPAPPPPSLPADPVARMLLERLEAEKPARHDDESRRDRVLWLIEYAQSEYIGGDYQTAVTALDLALDEAPDVASVQTLIQERAHSLIEIYASYEGDPSAVPSLAMQPSEYGQRPLDSHAAFLLSRVDGMLTIDDLMTVSGMPQLEAHRHLCNLLRQGILTLR